MTTIMMLLFHMYTVSMYVAIILSSTVNRNNSKALCEYTLLDLKKACVAAVYVCRLSIRAMTSDVSLHYRLT